MGHLDGGERNGRGAIVADTYVRMRIDQAHVPLGSAGVDAGRLC
jgi:hypothetical protein